MTLSHLITLGEGFTTEFKRSLPSDLGREICAFANSAGGVILIGVDDVGNVIGVGDHNRLKSQVQSIARSVDPPVAVEVESQCGVLCVTVPEQHGVTEPHVQVSPDWLTVIFPRQEAGAAPHVPPMWDGSLRPYKGK